MKLLYFTLLWIVAATAQEVVLEDAAAVAASVLPTLIGADGITQVAAAQQLGLSGRGVRVCVVDETIDIQHPTFGNCKKAGDPPPPECRVYTSYNGATGKDELVLQDWEFHGTHVAGIAVGAFPFKLMDAAGNPIPYQRGVAYGALLGAFSYGATTADMLASMNKTISRKCDIINMSFGSSVMLAWRWQVIRHVMQDYEENDIIAVSAASNFGRSQGGTAMYSGADVPGIYPNAISVASTENTATPGSLLELSDAIDTPTGPRSTLVAIDRTDNKVTVTSPITDAFNLPQDILLFETVPAGDGCSPLSSPGVMQATKWQGKVFLLYFKQDCPDSWTAREVWNSVIDMKPSLVLVALPTTELAWSASTSLARDSISTQLNLLFLKPEDGVALADALAALKPGKTLKLLKLPGANVNPLPSDLAGQPADYSSLGPAMDLSMKPDIAAPGTLYSSLPDDKYGTLFGTSMASPYLAGVAALWVEQMKRLGRQRPRGGWAAAVKVALKNTAKPMAYKDTSLVYPVVKVGAGLVQAYSAVATKVTITPAELPMRTGVSGQTFSLTLTNRDNKELTFVLGHKPAVGVSLLKAWYRLAYDESIPTARVSTVGRTVTVPAEGSITFRVNISLPEAALKLNDAILSGYITFTPVDMAAAGAAAAATVVDKQPQGQPDLATADLTKAAVAAESAATGTNLPIILSVPYQAVSGDYSTLGRPKSMALFAEPMPGLNAVGAQMLLGKPKMFICDALQFGCVYKPDVAPYTIGFVNFPGVYIAAPFIRPVRGVQLQVHAANGTLLGVTQTFGPCRASGPLEVGMLVFGYCDRLSDRRYDSSAYGWDGSYLPVGGGNKMSVEVGNTYSLKALIYSAFAAPDRGTGRKPQQQPLIVDISNKLKVVK